jgi:hypothetical protein
MSTSRLLSRVAVLAVLAGFASRPPSPLDEPRVNLPNISDANPEEPQLTHVVLRPEGNVISIINAPLKESERYTRVEMSRRDTEADSFRPHGTISFPPPPDVRSLSATFPDTMNSGLANRYEFEGFTAAGERVRVPVLYATTDSAYAAAVRAR